MAFKKGSAEAKKFMAKLRAKKGKKKTTVSGTSAKTTKRKIKSILKADKKIMPHGYGLKSGKIKSISGIKKKPITKKSTHKDTKSHNVNIRVVSGISDYWLKELNNTVKVINQKEKDLIWHKKMSIDKLRKADLRKNDKQIISILKPQILKLKKHLTQIKKHIK